MHKKVILSLCRFVTPKLHEKGTFGRLLEASSAEAASSCKTFGAPKHDPNTTHVKMPKKKTPTASNDHNISFKTYDASYVLTNKSGKIVAKYVGGKHKGSKTCVWVPKVLVSNVKEPKTIWVPKNKA
jgi:hypothetical protein